MQRLIDADELMKKATNAKNCYPEMLVVGLGYVFSAPTIDPIRYGHWIHEPGNVPKCSECGRYSDDAMNGAEICPWCGSHNDLEVSP